MKIRPRASIAPRLAAVAVVGMLLAALGAYEYVQMAYFQSESRSHTASGSGQNYSASTSMQSQIISSSSGLQVLSLPCAEKPLTPSYQSKIYSNGTEVTNFGYPIFTLPPSSRGTFCMTYSNGSNESQVSSYRFSALDWNSSVQAAGVSVTANTSSLSIPPRQNATVVYVVDTSDSSTGYYSLNTSTCGSLELAVSTDPSTSNFSDFSGLLSSVGPLAPGSGCMGSGWLPGALTGFDGFGSVYLQNTTRTPVGFNTTGASIVSVVQSPTRQNITVNVDVHSFSFPLTLVFATGESTFSTIGVFKGNPEMSPTPGDPCDWSAANASAYDNGNENEVSVLAVPGITVNAPTIHMQPFTNATFKFSMEIDNPPPGYYVTFLGFVIQWKNSPNNDNAVNLATFFPINAGSGQLDENITGTCVE